MSTLLNHLSQWTWEGEMDGGREEGKKKGLSEGHTENLYLAKKKYLDQLVAAIFLKYFLVLSAVVPSLSLLPTSEQP